jgi:Tfp pilus assembly protein PilN
MFKINLVPEAQERKLAIKKAALYSNLGAALLIGLIILSTLIITGIRISKQTELNATKVQITNLNTEIAGYKELEETVLSLENGLAAIKQIANGDNAWTNLLPHIEKATPGDVRYTNLKLNGDAVQASLRAPSVDSLAKMVDSFKQYKVIVLSGTGQEGQAVSVALDASDAGSGKVKNDGTWHHAISFDPGVDHEIKIAVAGGDPISLKYTAVDKKIGSTDTTVTAKVENLFTNVTNNKYERVDGEISFDINFNFDRTAIW